MRFVRGGKDLGGFYSYKMYGGTLKAIKAAMSRHQQLKIAKPRKREAHCGNVSWFEKYDKRRGKTTYGYQVFYYSAEGKLRNKNFGFGYRRPSANRQLHAFRTAKLFRYFFEIYGPDFDQSWFENWKHRRLYDSDKDFFDWYQDEKGEEGNRSVHDSNVRNSA